MALTKVYKPCAQQMCVNTAYITTILLHSSHVVRGSGEENCSSLEHSVPEVHFPIINFCCKNMEGVFDIKIVRPGVITDATGFISGQTIMRLLYGFLTRTRVYLHCKHSYVSNTDLFFMN